jgi:hypothetical protein
MGFGAAALALADARAASSAHPAATDLRSGTEPRPTTAPNASNVPIQSRPLLTSTTLQSHFAFGALFSGTFALVSFALLLWKGFRLPYPVSGRNVWGLEVFYLAAYCALEPVRLALGTFANRTLQTRFLYLSVALAAPSFGVHCYYAWGQTYALKLDVFLNVSGMCFIGAQVALSAFVVGAFPGKGATPASGRGPRPPGGWVTAPRGGIGGFQTR